MKEEATLENYDAKFEQAIRGLAKELAEYADVTYEQVMRLGEQTIYLLWHELHGYDPVCDEPPYEKIRRYVADDEKRLQEKENANKLRVLVAEPHKRAYVKTIVNSLEEMQKLYRDRREAFYNGDNTKKENVQDLLTRSQFCYNINNLLRKLSKSSTCSSVREQTLCSPFSSVSLPTIKKVP